MYGLACLEQGGSNKLLEALVERAGRLVTKELASDIRRGEQPARGAAPSPPPSDASAAAGSSGTAKEGRWAASASASASPAPAAANEAEPFVAADYASLVWGLATLGHRPSSRWMDALCRWECIRYVGRQRRDETAF